MYKKSVLVFILIAMNSVIVFGQERETILTAPDNWRSEVFPFPLGFAPTIDLIGFEDLRFAPGWSDSTSQEFWTYSFAWYIENNSAMTESKLTGYFNSYYDGLMAIDSRNQADTTKLNQLDKTRCLFLKIDEGYAGEMRVFDAFVTKDYMTLNIKVKESFCPKTNKQIILFDISPRDFDDAVWQIFDSVKLNVECE